MRSLIFTSLDFGLLNELCMRLLVCRHACAYGDKRTGPYQVLADKFILVFVSGGGGDYAYYNGLSPPSLKAIGAPNKI